jgi:alkaline phosphatase
MSNREEDQSVRRLGRRAFLQGGTLLLAGSTVALGDSAWLLAATDENAKPKLRIGLATDLHYADKPPSGTRHHRESLTKFSEAAKRFQQEKPDHVIALGDIIDSAASLDTEKDYLKQVVKDFAPLPGKHHFVLGNHCVENLTKPEFLGIVGQEKSYYSFDAAGYHFVILDACFNKEGAPYGRRNFKSGDANIPPAEMEWLRADLDKTEHKTIACVHQCLDLLPPYGVQNCNAAKSVLQKSGKVTCVLQGHFHFGNYSDMHGIHYCTIHAIVEGSGPENNAYAMLDILPGDVFRLTGFRKQKSYQWP